MSNNYSLYDIAAMWNRFLNIIVVSFAWTLRLTLTLSSATEELENKNYITINHTTGENIPLCLESKYSSYYIACKTLSYVFSHASLSNTEVVLQGDHWLDRTLIISNIDGLTIRASGTGNSTIHCRQPTTPNDTGSGLLFVSVSKLTILNVIMEQCGMLRYSSVTTDGVSEKHRSAILIINSTNINIKESTFHRNVGRGLFLYKVNGQVNISKCEFLENAVLDEEKKLVNGGGGLYIHLPCGSLAESECSSNYEIKDCMFRDNRATVSRYVDQTIRIRLSNGKDPYMYSSEGGGIDMHLSGSNQVTIASCTFHNNSARHGAGVYMLLQNYACNITTAISACTFTQNSAFRSGGALTIAHVVQSNDTGNNIVVEDTVFYRNKAQWGGAVNIYTSKTDASTHNCFHFINCQWIENSASIGSAMVVKPAFPDYILDGVFPSPVLHSCSFINNHPILMGYIVISLKDDNSSRHAVEVGVIDVFSMKIELSKHVRFIGNTGSAIVAKSAQINVLEDTLAEFINNTASYGGAMALYGFSLLMLFSGSQLSFVSNRASELGGAIYATSPHQSDFIFSHRCFISYTDYVLEPNKWNTSLTFINNTAKYGHAIYVDSLLPCAKNLRVDFESYINSALKWTTFTYTPPVDQYTIATSPADVHFKLPPLITPGEIIHLHLLSKDDLDQSILSSYHVMLESVTGTARTNAYISDDGYLQIYGIPGTEFNLTLTTQNTRLVSSTRAGRLGNCPIGFTLEHDKCVCSAGTRDKQFVGMPKCNMHTFQAYLQTGYWIGCTDSGQIITGYCPFEYCHYKNLSDNSYILLPKTCKELDICTSHRRGYLCGECEEGYTAYYHSQKHKCGKCQHGALGILIYLVSELLPLILLFTAVMILKVNMTSGIMQSLLLFAQTITLINHTPSVLSLSERSSRLIEIHNFLMGFLSLNMFQIDKLSFCLWTGATALDNLLFSYLTIFFAFMFLGGLVLIIEHSPNNIKFECCKRLIHVLKQSKTPIIHCITTLLILPYTKYTVTSFQILSRLTVIGEGGVVLRSVVDLQGNVEYFGPKHLFYAIPAVLVLLFFTLPPPLLLISYPLLWKIKAKFRFTQRADDDVTFWPIRKLLPLIDSFQGVFKDNCRMFSGLLLLWRVILAAIFAFSSQVYEFYYLLSAAILSIFTIHIVMRPYKLTLHNFIDILMLGNMYVVTRLSSGLAIWDTVYSRKFIESMITLKIILMYLPLLFLTGYMIFMFLERYHLLPKNEYFLNFEGKWPRVKTLQKVLLKQTTVTEEELFTRAAELNSPPLTLSARKVGSDLQSKSTNPEDTDSKDSNGTYDRNTY